MRTRSNRHPITATLAVVATAAAAAVPALAASDDRQQARPRLDLADIGAWIARIDPRPPRPPRPGPFVPVTGKADYGTAANAFGAARSGHVHAGQDVFAPAGRPLVAVSAAVVADAGSDGGQGNYVHLYDRKRDRTYVYMHMVAPTPLKRGEEVRAGERVGAVGCTGSCWGDHLHFEVRERRGFTGEPRDPMPLMRDWKRLERPR